MPKKSSKYWDEVAARHKAAYDEVMNEASEDYDRHPFENDKEFKTYKKKKEAKRTKEAKNSKGIEKEYVADTYD